MLTHYEKYSDTQLVQLYRRGDKAAGDILCKRYWAALYRFFKRRIRDAEVSKDLVQETFLEMLKSLRNDQSPKFFRCWLYKIGSRVLSKWIERQDRGIRQISLDNMTGDETGDVSFATAFLAPRREQPEHQTIDKEFGDIRCSFEATLCPRALEIWCLRWNSPMTFKEIGDALDMDPRTAKVQYHRTVKAFKAWLKKHYPDIYEVLNEKCK